VLDNGSGLSRLARISASQLAALLQYAWQQPWGLDLASSLPRAGMDGTLQNRMRTTTARDSARLKTGTLRNGTGLAGYVFDRQHRPWIFVGLVNAEQGVAKGRLLLDKWVEQVSQF
jgi:D-alanyl-D-alanine carboxypeptidase/D-alanyl-D-alanine-endopeptidase (penicillin-binding protein 4)